MYVPLSYKTRNCDITCDMVFLASSISASITDERGKKDKERIEELPSHEKAKLVEHRQLFLLVLLRSASRVSRILILLFTGRQIASKEAGEGARERDRVHARSAVGTTPNHIMHMHADSELVGCRESARSTQEPPPPSRRRSAVPPKIRRVVLRRVHFGVKSNVGMNSCPTENAKFKQSSVYKVALPITPMDTIV